MFLFSLFLAFYELIKQQQESWSRLPSPLTHPTLSWKWHIVFLFFQWFSKTLIWQSLNPVFTLLPDRKGLYNTLCLASSPWNVPVLFWALNHTFTVSFACQMFFMEKYPSSTRRFFRCFCSKGLLVITSAVISLNRPLLSSFLKANS